MSELHLRLPATSANLGPGFDTLALALKLYLSIDARPSQQVSIEATGRNAEICAATEENLLLETYSSTLAAANREFVPLALRVRNEIPIGMGCGSSAAVRLAGVALASHFGGLRWTRERILAEAALLEGHPDNAAACWLGGFVASELRENRVEAISIAPPPAWHAIVVVPAHPLATTASRAVLPAAYSRADVVANLQNVALLTAVFATGRGELMAAAMSDRLHQPYRSEVCPLLPRLLPLAGKDGIAGVALSGAGPSVLLLAESQEAARAAQKRVTLELAGAEEVDFLICGLESNSVLFPG